MGRNLTPLYISSSFQYLVQTSGSEFQDGLGNTLTSVNITASDATYALTAASATTAISASFATTASFALNVTPLDTGSFVVTASAVNATTTYTKGDGSTFNTVINNVATATSASHALIADVALNIPSVDTGSLLENASVTDAVTTYTRADGTTFATTAINNVANATSALIAVSASHAVIADSALSANTATTATTASYVLGSNVDGEVSSAATATSSSYALTASFAENVTPQETGSFMITGSVVGNLLTFNKGDGSTFNLEVSATASSAESLVTASISNSTITFTKGDASTFDITVNNVVNANSASYVLGTNVDGAVASATSASHALIADLATTATTATSSSYASTALSASYASTATSASYSLNSTNAVSAQTAVSASYATTASFALNVTPPVTSSFMITGSVAANVLTFTKGDASTFALTLDTGSFVDTGSYVMNVADIYASTPKIQEIVTLTQAEYNALAPFDQNTLYVINDSTGSLIVSASYAISSSEATHALTADTATSASYVPLALETGSVSGNELTFTKFNGDTFALTVDTGSGGGGDPLVLNWSASAPSSTEYAIFVEDYGNQSPTAGSGSFKTLAFYDKQNIALGQGALSGSGFVVGTAEGNIALGSRGGEKITTGKGNFIVATSDGSTNTTATALTTGNRNIIIGKGAGQNTLTTGEENILMGSDTNITSFNNSGCVHIGSASNREGGSGANAVRIGKWSGYTGNGAESVNIGYRTGFNDKGSNNIYIGQNVQGQSASTNTSSNQLAIGSDTNAVDNLLYGVHSGTKELTVNGKFTVSGSVTNEVNVISDSAGTTTMDCSLGNFFTLAMPSGGTTALTPSNIQPGQTISVKITQNATAALLTFAASIEFEGGTAFTISTGSGEVDVMTFISFDGTTLQATGLTNFS